MKITLLKHVLLPALLAIAAGPGKAITVSNLRCEYQKQPLDIDCQQPRLSWNLNTSQRGDRGITVRVIVSSSLARLQSNIGDMWTERVGLDNFPVAYNGKLLHSGETCYWKVQALDRKGVPGPWSTSARWEMGFLKPSDWKAIWINDGKKNPVSDADFYRDDPAPLFRKAFKLEKQPIRARLAITGLGYCEPHLNGYMVSDSRLGPAWTKVSKRVYYSIYDVTHRLRIGSNCLGVTLGNGWYNPLPLRMWGNYDLRNEIPVGRPRFIAQLEIEYRDGTRQRIVSDTSWKVTDGPILRNSIYLGELYDARAEIGHWDTADCDESSWRSPAVSTEPVGSLQSQSQPPIRVTRTIPVHQISEPKPGVYIFDLGQNFAGSLQFSPHSSVGTHITLRYGELLHTDGTLNPMTSVAGQVKGTHRLVNGTVESIGGPGAPPIAWQTDTYICSGRPTESYSPRFTWHGFRYVEVTGLTSPPSKVDMTGLRMNSDVERVGLFVSSSTTLNRIQEMCDNTFLSNIFSVQSDCPHRERFGYGGDLVATCHAFMMNYNMDRFYAKVVADWQDSALEGGMLTDTAPFVGIQYCGLGWAMAHPLVQLELNRYYSDHRIVEEQFGVANTWLSRVDSETPSHIIQNGLSDHESIVPTSTPVLVTPLYYRSALILAQLADISARSQVGNASAERLRESASRWRTLAESIRIAYNAKYVDATTGKVGDGTQACQAFALANDIVPTDVRPRVFKHLVERIEGVDNLHVTTGISGTKYMLEVLSRGGRGDLAYKLVTRSDYPGWVNMLDNGATTLWEHWQGSDNTFSLNHPMFGSVSEWLFQWIGGIEPDGDVVSIHPLFIKELNNVTCRYRSIRGDILCRWTRKKQMLSLDVTIPVGLKANIQLDYAGSTSKPGIREGGKPLNIAPGIRNVSHSIDRPDATAFEAESGLYHFEVVTQ